MLTSTAFVAAVLSASFSWAQCCGGAGNGCCYTVMKTVKRTVMEQQQKTCYRTVYENVYEDVQVPCTRMVRETKCRTESYQVRRPVREVDA